MPTLDPVALTEFAAALLTSGGVAADEAELVAGSLVAANLRGHDSHGVMRIPFYLGRVKAGDVVPGAPFTIVRETRTSIVAQGNWGFGQTQATRLTRRLIEMALAEGTAMGTLIHSSHVGRLGEYCEVAADEGLVSMAMANTHGTIKRVAPIGGTAPRLGTNPLAIGVPCGDETLLLDFGTSATAEGKVRIKRIAGERVAEGLLLDSAGRPTTDPADLYADPPGTIRPMGGDQAYKGFALSLMIEIFAGALSGGPCAREVPENPLGNCLWMLLIDPDHLAGRAHFADQVRALAEYVRGCPRVEGVDAILLPGDPERRALADRSREGIPLDDGNYQALVDLAEELNVPVPT